MAGHSKFKNIQHRKGAEDKKRGKIFTKLVKEIIVAVQIGGDDPSSNPRLRSAITNARSQNLPKERIERAIGQGANKSDETNYTEIRYEGFAPGGVGIIAEVLTDNKNRSAAEVRSIFNKFGGSMGETGSVSFMFEHLGCIFYDKSNIDQDKITEAAIEFECKDVDFTSDLCTIYTEINDFHKISEKLQNTFGEPQSSYIGWVSTNKLPIKDQEQKEKLEKMIDAMQDCDDVQRIFTNSDLQA